MKDMYKFYIAVANTPLLIREATTEQLEAEVKRRKDQQNRDRYIKLLAEYSRLEEHQLRISSQMDEIEDELDELDELTPKVNG